MKIMMIGGNLSTINGYTNAVLKITETIAKTEDVFFMPLFPVFKSKKINQMNNISQISKNIRFRYILKSLKDLKSSYKPVSDYICPLTFSGSLYWADHIYHRALLENSLSEIKPDIVHVHGLILDTLPFIELLSEKKVPFCVTLHALAYNDSNVELKYNKNFEEKELNKFVKENTQITVVSNQMKKNILEDLDIPARIIHFIPNGADSSRFNNKIYDSENIKGKYNMPSDKIIILQIGTLNKRKNNIAVLKSLSQMPEDLREKIHYVSIGDGPEKKNLQDYVKENNIEEYCTFTGMISDEDRDSLYLLSDLFILPSTSEGMALVMLDALAVGLPVITFSSLEGINDIYNEDCFQLIHGRDTREMIDAIEIAVNKNWNRSKIIEYSKEWNWESSCEKYIQLYNEIISKK